MKLLILGTSITHQQENHDILISVHHFHIFLCWDTKINLSEYWEIKITFQLIPTWWKFEEFLQKKWELLRFEKKKKSCVKIESPDDLTRTAHVQKLTKQNKCVIKRVSFFVSSGADIRKPMNSSWRVFEYFEFM